MFLLHVDNKVFSQITEKIKAKSQITEKIKAPITDHRITPPITALLLHTSCIYIIIKHTKPTTGGMTTDNEYTALLKKLSFVVVSVKLE